MLTTDKKKRMVIEIYWLLCIFPHIDMETVSWKIYQW